MSYSPFFCIFYSDISQGQGMLMMLRVSQGTALSKGLSGEGLEKAWQPLLFALKKAFMVSEVCILNFNQSQA